MPVSVTNSRLIYDALKACDIKIISALPETWLVHLIRMADEDPGMTLVRLAKEEEGVGISAGAHLAGVNSAMLMQNHGFLAAINPIVSLALLYKIPLLITRELSGAITSNHAGNASSLADRMPILLANCISAQVQLSGILVKPGICGRDNSRVLACIMILCHVLVDSFSSTVSRGADG